MYLPFFKGEAMESTSDSQGGMQPVLPVFPACREMLVAGINYSWYEEHTMQRRLHGWHSGGDRKECQAVPTHMRRAVRAVRVGLGLLLGSVSSAKASICRECCAHRMPPWDHSRNSQERSRHIEWLTN